ncbi:MFS monocarboxylate transporter-like protein [Westerdykella ornata]|uniref:MFS monocarboxylate transporter-like protein n=1 Tax=Westerdykella ornata TaxID=318751 RepID=A0A6A6JE18_WESOR|nr:MFS monocarboxylate transporter-like protein [Westerdykella ornata]KAF2273429.1 MFS monocarboxylate transporter-like protein [Westerdykella ornata]
MTHDPNGSTPGLFTERNQLTRANTFPSVEFSIPPSDPIEQIVTRCRSHPTHSFSAPARGEKNEAYEGDGDGNSVVSHLTEVSYPEGGLQAWLVVLGSFSGSFVGFGMMNTIGVFTQYFSEHQLKSYNESTIGWIFGVYVFLSFFCGIQIGPVFDAHGPRMLVIAGSIFVCACMFLLGICTLEYWHFMIVFGVLGGIGTSLIFTPAFAAVGHFFLEKRANATGIAAAGGSFGGIIFPLLLRQLLPSVEFAWATRILGFIFVFCCGLAILLIRSRLPPKPGQSVMPDFTIFKDPPYLLLTLGIYFMEWGLFIPITYITSFSASSGALSTAFSYQLVAIFNAGSCLGRWAPGYMADKLGRFNSMIGMLALCAATTVTFWLPASLIAPTVAADTSSGAVIKGLIIVYAVIFGFASGSNISLTPVCVGQLCETNQYGRYYATCYTVVSFGTLTGIPIAGALIQAAGGRYWGVVVWTLLCYVVSLGCFIWSRGLAVGWKLGVKF